MYYDVKYIYFKLLNKIQNKFMITMMMVHFHLNGYFFLHVSFLVVF